MPQMNQSLSILTGCSAGATEAIVVVPFELRSYALSTCLAQLSLLRLVKIRLQDKASTYAGPADVVRKIIASEGVLGMYNGMESTFWR